MYIPKFVPPSKVMNLKSGQIVHVVWIRKMYDAVYDGTFMPLGKKWHNAYSRFERKTCTFRPSCGKFYVNRKGKKTRYKYPNLPVNYSSVASDGYNSDACRRPYRYCFKTEKDALQFVTLFNSGYPILSKVDMDNLNDYLYRNTVDDSMLISLYDDYYDDYYYDYPFDVNENDES